MIKKVFKIIIGLIIALVLIFAIFLGWQTVTEFKPADEQSITINEKTPPVDDTLSLITWNTGYFGLGAEMDFFYEGGTKVRPEKELYSRYISEGLDRLRSFNTCDFILLQEVDTSSHRTYSDNQLLKIREALPGYHSFYASNYNAWVPIPFSEPMGKVNAGLATLSKNEPVNARRVSFHSSYSWPMRLFQLKRCFLELRYNTLDGKQLVVINTHNSAFEDASAMREEELGVLQQLMKSEFAKGNYVIIGGDWNQNPATYDTNAVLKVYRPGVITPGIPDDFLPDGWHYAYDPMHTTNRYVKTPYIEGETGSTLIDFYVVSPNIEVLDVETLTTHFKESDHQPVRMKVRLKAKG